VTRPLVSGWIAISGFGAGEAAEGRFHTRQELDRYLAAPPAGKPSRNYGRFDLPTRLVCHAVHLALRAAGYRAERPFSEGAGLIGTGDLGTLAANLAYYRDYCENGKVLARSNLFLYTLPTSPLAEAAILFRLRGPLFFLTAGPEGSPAAAVQAAGDLLDDVEVPCMLVCDAAPTAVIVHVMEAASGREVQAALEAAASLRRIVAGREEVRA
jgi:hypothetical protein